MTELGNFRLDKSIIPGIIEIISIKYILGLVWEVVRSTDNFPLDYIIHAQGEFGNNYVQNLLCLKTLEKLKITGT